MGTYLSKPKTEKVSEDGENHRVKYGLSSMQGWRSSMEDAHAALPDLDSSTSFFAVYDGHGGKAVAKFCAKLLHKELLTDEAYMTGDLAKALRRAFLRMDEMIRTNKKWRELIWDDREENDGIDDELFLMSGENEAETDAVSNEVLLGENYFADRTAKQTVDILKRRGQALESQVGSVKAVIEDLKAKASFYDRTAAESEEGLVEIREELSDDEDAGASQEKEDAASVCEVGNRSRPGAVDDEEYARIMSRLDELEKEELEEEEEGTEELGDVTRDENFNNLDQEQSKDHHHTKVLSDRNTLPNDANNLIHGSLSLQSTHKDESSRGKNLLQNLVERSTEEDYAPLVMKTSVPFETKLKSEICVPTPKPDASNRLSRDSRPNTDSLKAFTGSIIERTDNLQISPEKETIDQPSNPQPSKPVSRFKMQRRAV